MTTQEFIDVLENLGYEPQSYSGRGIYGRKCVGVATGDVFKLGPDIWSDEEAREFIECCSPATDSMGFDTIVYWPNVVWPDESED
ncbi:MAG: hypothetical protein WC551_08745 [Patescibacteria group bacterium]